MRLDEAKQVDMVLGEGVRERGAAVHEISEDTPGVAWAKIDGRRDPDRARAFHTTDADLDELCDYVAAGRHGCGRGSAHRAQPAHRAESEDPDGADSPGEDDDGDDGAAGALVSVS